MSKNAFLQHRFKLHVTTLLTMLFVTAMWTFLNVCPEKKLVFWGDTHIKSSSWGWPLTTYTVSPPPNEMEIWNSIPNSNGWLNFGVNLSVIVMILFGCWALFEKFFLVANTTHIIFNTISGLFIIQRPRLYLLDLVSFVLFIGFFLCILWILKSGVFTQSLNLMFLLIFPLIQIGSFILAGSYCGRNNVENFLKRARVLFGFQSLGAMIGFCFF